jgi:tetratricopeptide (TPR) repeat protein
MGTVAASTVAKRTRKFIVGVEPLVGDDEGKMLEMIVKDLAQRDDQIDVRRVAASDLSVDPAKYYPDDEGTLSEALRDAGVDLLIWGKVFVEGGEKRPWLFMCARPPLDGDAPTRDLNDYDVQRLSLPAQSWKVVGDTMVFVVLAQAVRFDDGRYPPASLNPFVERMKQLQASTAFSAGTGDWSPEARWETLRAYGLELLDLGIEQGDREALQKSVHLLRAAVHYVPEETAATAWRRTVTLHHLAAALLQLGWMEVGAKSFEEAVTVYRAALDRSSPQRPLEWGGLQAGLGDALLGIGDRQDAPDRLREAAVAFRAAIHACPRRMAVLQWASAQHGLGRALYLLGEDEPGTKRLEQSVAAYRQALEERTRERAPSRWAASQHGLGTALRLLGSRQNGQEALQQSITAFRAALEVRTRDRMPQEWADSQDGLANALKHLGMREGGTEFLEQSVAAFRAALEVRTRQSAPTEWAVTQTRLGSVLLALGERQAGTGRIDEAIAMFRRALEVQSKRETPLHWAATQTQLGNALVIWGGRQVDPILPWNEALLAFQAALSVYPRETKPLDWAGAQSNVANTLADIGRREEGTTRLEEAVRIYRQALEVVAREREPALWADLQNNIGTALLDIGRKQSGTARFLEALAAFREAETARPRETMPLQWASIEDNIGLTLLWIGYREQGTVRVEEAIAAYERALLERTKERMPYGWAKTQSGLGDSQAELAKRRSEPPCEALVSHVNAWSVFHLEQSRQSAANLRAIRSLLARVLAPTPQRCPQVPASVWRDLVMLKADAGP